MIAITQNLLNDEALDKIMDLFWRKGYATTSIEDIVTQTGLHRSAIYKHFNDKEGLFLAMLKRFRTQITAQFTAPLYIEHNGVESIKSFFSQMLPMGEQNDTSKGCFLIATASDLSSHSKEVHAFIADFFTYLRTLFHQQLVYDQEQRKLNNSLDAEAIADFLVGNLFGAMTLFRSHAPKMLLLNHTNGVIDYLTALTKK